jgi:hypothetical protein
MYSAKGRRMTVKRVVANIATARVADAAAFYGGVLGMRARWILAGS